MEHLTCNECGLIVLVSSMKIDDGVWNSSPDERTNFLCYFCNDKAPEDKKFRIAPHKLKKQEIGVHIEEEDPYESLGSGDDEEEHKPITKSEDPETVKKVLEQEN